MTMLPFRAVREAPRESEARDWLELSDLCEKPCALPGNHLLNDGKMPIEVQPPFGSVPKMAAVVEAVHQEHTMAKWRIEDSPILGVPRRHGARRKLSARFAGSNETQLDSRRIRVMA